MIFSVSSGNIIPCAVVPELEWSPNGKGLLASRAFFLEERSKQLGLRPARDLRPQRLLSLWTTTGVKRHKATTTSRQRTCTRLLHHALCGSGCPRRGPPPGGVQTDASPGRAQEGNRARKLHHRPLSGIGRWQRSVKAPPPPGRAQKRAPENSEARRLRHRQAEQRRTSSNCPRPLKPLLPRINYR